MESGVTKAIFDKLRVDATLTAALATYMGAPAILSGRTIPADADLPAILITGPVGSTTMDTLDTEGREEERSIELWSPGSASAKAIAETAERIRSLLHRKPLSVPGGTVVRVTCSGPETLPADGQYDGRLVTCRVRYTVP